MFNKTRQRRLAEKEYNEWISDLDDFPELDDIVEESNKKDLEKLLNTISSNRTTISFILTQLFGTIKGLELLLVFCAPPIESELLSKAIPYNEYEE